MKTVAIVAEFNPFHTGHEYIIKKAKEITGAEYVVVIMSGNFVQRGEPAIINKYLRTTAAIKCGADLVIELPIRYATSSAEYFARGAIKLLNSLNFIDYLVFGSEDDNIEYLDEIADIFTNEPEGFRDHLKKYLKQGLSYPVSRANALEIYKPHLVDILNKPNNILAIEYLKALKRTNSLITPYVIKRIHNNYNNTILDEDFSSSTAIREAIKKDNLESIKNHIPEFLYEDLISNYNHTYPIFADDFSLLLGANLIKQNFDYHTYDTADVFNFEWELSLKDINTDLDNRIKNLSKEYTCFTEFADEIKSKNETYSAISRKLLSITLGLNDTDKNLCKTDIPEYIRVLGFREESKIMKVLSNNCLVPVITKNSDGLTQLSGDMLRCYKTSLYCDNIYKQVCVNKFHNKNKPTDHFNLQLDNYVVIYKQ